MNDRVSRAGRFGVAALASALSIAPAAVGQTAKPAAAQDKSIAASLVASAASPSEAEANTAASAWRTLFLGDIAYLERTISDYYIYAVYPANDPAWEKRFSGALAQARSEAAKVEDWPTYRAVLQHFIAAFEDAHLSAYFTVASRNNRWPGFAVRYEGSRFAVAISQVPGVENEQRVESCDGEAINAWVDRLAPLIGGPKGRDTTRAAIGSQMFLDGRNPLYRLPAVCRIGGKDVALSWRPVPTPPPVGVPVEPERTSAPVPTIDDPTISVSDFGTDGAWVRMGTMMTVNPQQVAQFQDLIASAPTLRQKDVVVLDVRGNSGGMYNWFMAFLRAFYGQPYADYYARARLEIANVIYSPPGTPVIDATAAIQRPPGAPADPPMESLAGRPDVRTLPNGGTLTRTVAPIVIRKYPARPPMNPVKARVILLTDYGCASACLSFTDEMRRFPGVVQVGTETHIDRRSGGWPEAFNLPSGLAVVRMGRMLREGRKRGDNEAWAPTIRFSGDIADTAAVKQWIAKQVLTGRTSPK